MVKNKASKKSAPKGVNNNMTNPQNDQKGQRESDKKMSRTSSADFPPLDSYPEDHQDEYLTTEAIYPEGFRRVHGRKDAWQPHENLAFEAVLTSLTSPDYFIRLEFVLPKDYPKAEPKVVLLELEPEVPVLRTEIVRIISTFPRENRGERCVPLITAAVADLLDQKAFSQAGKHNPFSLEEEKAQRDAAAIRKAQADAEKLRRQLDQQSSEAAQQLTSNLESERSKRQRRLSDRRDSTASDDMTTDFKERSFIYQFDNPMTCIDGGTGKTLTFKEVIGGVQLIRRKDKTVTVVVPNVPREYLPPSYLLKAIRLPVSLISQEVIRDVEDAVRAAKEQKQKNIVQILAYRIEKSMPPEVENVWQLIILTEYATKGNMWEFLMIDTLEARKVRRFALDLLEALAFFEQHGYVHPAVTLTNVLIFLTSEGEISVKLSDGYGMQLRRLVEQARDPDHPLQPEKAYWSPPELKDNSRTSRACVWELATVVLSMYLGRDFKEKVTRPENYKEMGDFSIHFMDFIQSMLKDDPNQRKSASKLRNSLWITSNVPRVLKTDYPQSDIETEAVNRRYRREYEPIMKLGEGAFGSVHKVKHNLTGTEYAVKKIENVRGTHIPEILNEVTLLERLRGCSQIVQYYHAWQEEQVTVIPPPVLRPEPTESSSSAFGPPPPNFSVPLSLDDDIFGASTNQFISYGQNIGPEFGDSSEVASAPDVEEEQEESSESRNNWMAVQSGRSSSSGEDNDDDNNQNENGHNDSNDEDEERVVQNIEVDVSQQRYTIYILMEFCEKKTLKDVIQQGLWDNREEIWRLLRGILEGLVFMQKLNVTHRDLKPVNIFIDAQASPKIGDFGLATTNQLVRDETSSGLGQVEVDSEVWQGVGTPLYMAPEVRKNSGANSSYTFKVDMFSLGLILTEMCCKFSTEQERRRVLLKAGEKSELPPLFDTEDYHAFKKIILQLLDHDPAMRPSAAELLQSEDIPKPPESKQVRQFVQAMGAENTDEYRKIIDLQLSRGNPLVQDLAWDRKDEKPSTGMQMSIHAHVNRTIEDIFQRHGALQSTRPTIVPKYEDPKNAVTFVEASGLVVQLPTNLTIPLARHLAYHDSEDAKLYNFGTIYKPQGPGDEPRAMPEIDIDLISSTSSDIFLKDAEIIKILDEIINAFPSLQKKKVVIYINHNDILDQILKFCRMQNHIPRVKEILATTTLTKSFNGIREQLRSSPIDAAETSIMDVRRFIMSGPFLEVRDQILKIVGKGEVANNIRRTLTRLEETFNYITRFNVSTPIIFAPLSNYAASIYSGSLMIQCICIDGQTTSTIAMGGRYDELIQEKQKKVSKAITRAVGIRISPQPIIRIINDGSIHASKSAKSISTSVPNKCNIFVLSFDSATRNGLCLDILASLWDAGLGAELAIEAKSIQAVEEKLGKSNWLVIVKPENAPPSDKSIKIRTPSKEEKETPLSELVSFLKLEIGETVTATTETPVFSLKRSMSSGTGGAVQVHVPSHKAKKVNRQHIVGGAHSAVLSLTDKMKQDASILAIDTSDEVLSAMKGRRVCEDVVWKGVRQVAAPQERQYLDEAQKALKSWASEGKDGAFVYNYKTKACVWVEFEE